MGNHGAAGSSFFPRGAVEVRGRTMAGKRPLNLHLSVYSKRYQLLWLLLSLQLPEQMTIDINPTK